MLQEESAVDLSRRGFVVSTVAGGAYVALSAGPGEGDTALAKNLEHGSARRHVEPLRPVAVTSSEGRVRGADAMLSGGVMTLTLAAGGVVPSVVLDYGREVGGYPVFEVVDVSGTPRLEAAYSEALPWLLPDGDGPAPGTPDTNDAAVKDISYVGIPGGADLNRVERLPVVQGRHENRLMQGGQRFQAIRLTTPGSVSLRAVGVLPAFYLPTRRRANEGRFTASDRRLGRYWHMGRRTLELSSVPVGAIKPIWDVTPQGLRVRGNTYSGYQAGVKWTDYTATVEFEIARNEASVLVRASMSNGLRIVLCAADDDLPVSTPNTMRVYTQFLKEKLAEVPLPTELRTGEWHTLRTEVQGLTARISLDGTLLATVDFPAGAGFSALASGWFSLGNAHDAVAVFRNLHVVDPAGATLCKARLTEPEVLDLFAAGTNDVPSVLDGPKRDRLLFTGDLGVAGLNYFTSDYALEFLRGSIRLFSAYQKPSGVIPTSLPPTYNPGKTPRGQNESVGILDYTVHHVTTVHDYWWHTADDRFLREQWPALTHAMAFLEGSVQDDGLLAPPGPAGPTIAETLSNAHYVGALRAAAELADALGHRRLAEHYRSGIAPLRSAVNRLLYNDDLGLYGSTAADLDTVSQHANAYAVLYRVAPRRQVPGILRRLAETLATPIGPKQSTAADAHIGPYTAGYELLARFSVGDTAGALDIIRRVWREMDRGDGYDTGTCWEYVALDGTPGLGTGTSLCHPWSTMPTPALSKYVLGVRPLAPGYRRWLVEPQPGDLRHAAGRLPTPHGPIKVEWERSRGRFDLHVSAPRRTRGTVGLPAAGDRVSVNGRTVATRAADRGLPGYRYVDVAGSGGHDISAISGRG